MKVLVIAPHADDEVLGCGGTIVKHVVGGDTIRVCIVTTFYHAQSYKEKVGRRDEVTRVENVLGVREPFYRLKFPNACLDMEPQKNLNDRLEEIISGFRPDILYIPHGGDLHKDHRLVFEAALVAARPATAPFIKRILSYETLSETEWLPGKGFVPNYYIDITDFLETKLEAMKEYKSQLKDYPHPRSLERITSLAKKRGSEAYMGAAEAFIMIREVDRGGRVWKSRK